jgi:hypothetical protein
MHMNDSSSWFALIITDGVALEYPPELYESHTRAQLEGERWAWILSGTGWLEVERPFEGRWRVGDRDVRLVPVTLEREVKGELWLAQYWTEDGVPDPEALVLSDRDEALAWVREPPCGADRTVETIDLPWFVSATYRFGGEEAYAIASLAKRVVS